MDVLKVSSKSIPSSVAGAMAGVVRQHGAVEVQVVGAGALNQAIKAVAIARGYLAPSGIDVVCVPTFVDVQIDGQSRTALRLSIEDRNALQGSPARAVVDLRDTEPVKQAEPAHVQPTGPVASGRDSSTGQDGSTERDASTGRDGSTEPSGTSEPDGSRAPLSLEA